MGARPQLHSPLPGTTPAYRPATPVGGGFSVSPRKFLLHYVPHAVQWNQGRASPEGEKKWKSRPS
jgi:hypothetical protein